MKRIIPLLLVFYTSLVSASEKPVTDPEELLLHLSQTLTEQLQTKESTSVQQVIDLTLMPHIDDYYIGLYVLGKHLKKLDKQQVKHFRQAFKQHLSTTYSNALSNLKQQRIELSPSKINLQGRKKVSIKAKLIDKGSPPIQLIFRLRKQKNGGWKIYDFIAEGISLLTTKRNEISRQISAHGFDQTVAKLH